jgi:hypothetical protein
VANPFFPKFMKFKTTTVLAALVLCGLGGFFAGRAGSPGQSPVSSDGPAETRRSSRGSSRNSINDSTAATRKIPRDAKSAHSGATTPKDPLARLDAIVRIENPLERNRALLAYLEQLGPGDFEKAVAHFRSLGITDSRTGEYSMLLSAWAQADPIAALTYAKDNTRGGLAQDTVLTTWAATDPEAAIRWAQSNHEGDGANPYMPGIIRGLAESNPARASELLASMPRSVERGKGLDFLLPHLLQQGPDAVHGWIASLKDDALRNGAMTRAADQLAETDPAGTVSWLLANPGEAAQRQMDDVYSAWADKDSQAALSSLGTLPAGEVRSNALRGVIRNVAVEDPKAGLALMDRYPSDVDDRTVQSFIWHSIGSDPASAIAQIARLGNEQEREQMYRRTLDHWIQRDPTAAQAWLQANPLPESVRNQLNRRQGEGQGGRNFRR